MARIEESDRKTGWARGIFLFVLLSLILSCVYAIFRIICTPAGPVPEIEHEKLKSDYVLMLIQCTLGIIVIFLPSVIERRLQIAIPNFMFLFFVLFLYAAIFLGEVRSFYYRVPHWDLILHGLSGLMLGALSFSVISLLNDTENIRTSMSPAFVAVFAFSFAVSIGVIWEIYEFIVDGVFGLNMQKHSLESGEPLIGRAALVDTMWDLILDAIGALIMSVVGYVSVKHRKGWISPMLVRRTAPAEDDR